MRGSRASSSIPAPRMLPPTIKYGWCRGVPHQRLAEPNVVAFSADRSRDVGKPSKQCLQTRLERRRLQLKRRIALRHEVIDREDAVCLIDEYRHARNHGEYRSAFRVRAGEALVTRVSQGSVTDWTSETAPKMRRKRAGGRHESSDVLDMEAFQSSASLISNLGATAPGRIQDGWRWRFLTPAIETNLVTMRTAVLQRRSFPGEFAPRHA